MGEKKNPFLIKAGISILKGLPVLKTIKDLIKPGTVSGTVTIDGKPTEVNLPLPRPHAAEVAVEIAVVLIVLAYVLGKITAEDLQALQSFLDVLK